MGGRVRRCRLEPQALAEAERWFEDYRRFWSDSLKRLDRLTADDPPADKERKRR